MRFSSRGTFSFLIKWRNRAISVKCKKNSKKSLFCNLLKINACLESMNFF